MEVEAGISARSKIEMKAEMHKKIQFTSRRSVAVRRRWEEEQTPVNGKKLPGELPENPKRK